MADENIAQKKCSACGHHKPASPVFFHRKLSGFASHCRECRGRARRKQFAELPAQAVAELNLARRERRAANAEAARKADRERYARDSSLKKASVQAYRERNPDKVKQSHRTYYESNRADRIAQAIARAKASPERRREACRAAYAKQRQDPMFRINQSVSAHVYYSLRGAKAGQRWERLVGYSLSDLVRHIERQFGKGMTWANYGAWHIDHVRPVSSFSFTSHDDEQFKDCWSLTNLRPMWAADNIRKGDKRLLLI